MTNNWETVAKSGELGRWGDGKIMPTVFSHPHLLVRVRCLDRRALLSPSFYVQESSVIFGCSKEQMGRKQNSHTSCVFNSSSSVCSLIFNWLNLLILSWSSLLTSTSSPAFSSSLESCCFFPEQLSEKWDTEYYVPRRGMRTLPFFFAVWTPSWYGTRLWVLSKASVRLYL